MPILNDYIFPLLTSFNNNITNGNIIFGQIKPWTIESLNDHFNTVSMVTNTIKTDVRQNPMIKKSVGKNYI